MENFKNLFGWYSILANILIYITVIADKEKEQEDKEIASAIFLPTIVYILVTLFGGE